VGNAVFRRITGSNGDSATWVTLSRVCQNVTNQEAGGQKRVSICHTAGEYGYKRFQLCFHKEAHLSLVTRLIPVREKYHRRRV